MRASERKQFQAGGLSRKPLMWDPMFKQQQGGQYDWSKVRVSIVRQRKLGQAMWCYCTILSRGGSQSDLSF